MKIYKLKLLGSDIYVKAVMIDTSNNELRIQPILTSDEEEAGIYEEEKAKLYRDKASEILLDSEFILEEVM